MNQLKIVHKNFQLLIFVDIKTAQFPSKKSLKKENSYINQGAVEFFHSVELLAKAAQMKKRGRRRAAVTGNELFAMLGDRTG